jgi:hypothetical protein
MAQLYWVWGEEWVILSIAKKDTNYLIVGLSVSNLSGCFDVASAASFHMLNRSILVTNCDVLSSSSRTELTTIKSHRRRH